MGEINIKGALLIIAIALILFIAGCSACSYYIGSKRTIRLSTSMEKHSNHTITNSVTYSIGKDTTKTYYVDDDSVSMYYIKK